MHCWRNSRCSFSRPIGHGATEIACANIVQEICSQACRSDLSPIRSGCWMVLQRSSACRLPALRRARTRQVRSTPTGQYQHSTPLLPLKDWRIRACVSCLGNAVGFGGHVPMSYVHVACVLKAFRHLLTHPAVRIRNTEGTRTKMPAAPVPSVAWKHRSSRQQILAGVVGMAHGMNHRVRLMPNTQVQHTATL